MNTSTWMDSRPSIDEQAATWYARRTSGQFTAEQEAELQAWLATSPAHAKAFADMQLIWADFDRVPRPVLATPVVMLKPRSRRTLPRAMAASFVLLCAALATSQDWFGRAPSVDLQLSSARGEQRQVELADGSRIDLNVDTRLHVRLYDDHREVELLQGEAFFAVARDERRPFVVMAGEGSVRVLGTRFSVRRGGERLDVAVESGKVAVSPEAGGSHRAELGAGDSADFDYRTRHLELGHRSPEEIASWRRGQLIFRDRPLAQLVDELSHYRNAPVGLADASLAERRVSGSLNIGKPDAFLAALPQLLPVRVEYLANGTALIHPR